METPKQIPYITGNGNPKKLLILQEMKLFSPPQENFFYFRKREPRKKFLYSLKRKLFLYFWKREPRNSEKASYISRSNLQSPKNKEKSLL